MRPGAESKPNELVTLRIDGGASARHVNVIDFHRRHASKAPEAPCCLCGHVGERSLNEAAIPIAWVAGQASMRRLWKNHSLTAGFRNAGTGRAGVDGVLSVEMQR